MAEPTIEVLSRTERSRMAGRQRLQIRRRDGNSKALVFHQSEARRKGALQVADGRVPDLYDALIGEADLAAICPKAPDGFAEISLTEVPEDLPKAPAAENAGHKFRTGF